MSRRIKAPSPALIVAMIALFVSIGGVGYAASKIGTNDIENKAVTKPKIDKQAVTTNRIADQAVKAKKLADQAVTTDKIADQAVTTDKIADQAVTTGKIANDAVTGDQVLNDSLTGDDINESTLGTVPSATNANTLDGQDSSAFLPSSSRGVAVAAARVTNTGSVLGYFNRSGGAPTVTHTANTGSYTVSFPGNSINVNIEIIQATRAGTPGEIAVDSVNGNVIVKTYNSAGAAADGQFTLVVFPASLSG